MAYGLWDQINWLTTRVKRLCCAVDNIKKSGAGSYRVFTGLITQTGNYDPNADVFIYGGPLVIGTTYVIQNNGGGLDDFRNVGAINNDVGTGFIATGTTPAVWTNGGFLSYNSADPVVTILDDNIGGIHFKASSNGYYPALSSTSAFTADKTFFLIGTLSDSSSADPFGTISIYYGTVSELGLITYDATSVAISDQLKNTPIEIRVYN